MKNQDPTVLYYDQNAEAFAQGTVDLDMGELWSKFLKDIPIGGSILDAGCGPGRDAAHFKNLGYDVTAFDASSALVEMARKRSGLPVLTMRFEDIDWRSRFDGIWASASLLHVPRTELIKIFSLLRTALKPSGIIYCSFKYGNADQNRGGRTFTDLDESQLADFTTKIGLVISESWITTDIRPGREDEKWLNAIVRPEQKL